jgi:hypothetical protein
MMTPENPLAGKLPPRLQRDKPTDPVPYIHVEGGGNANNLGTGGSPAINPAKKPHFPGRPMEIMDSHRAIGYVRG